MNEGDKIKVALVTELAGVPMTNILYFEVTDAVLITTLEAALLEIATSFNAAMAATRSSAAVLTCGTWENQDGNDPFTQAFFNIPGAGGANALPSDAGVRVARYGIVAADLITGGITIAGIVESQVNRGRLVGAGELGTIEQWMVNPLILAAGPTLAPGFYYDTSGPPLVPGWLLTTKARTRARIVSLSRRQSQLCGS
ncbi:unnamed protein product [marine sediment metagenome]|uniref:Uncharacterized protein n=1 Tax=marine sediment metagenome TaxID=412755 RepID=X1KPK8_9ZZZZ